MFHNPIGGGQAKPRALAGFLGGKEGLKYLLLQLLGDARALIGDLHNGIVPRGHLCAVTAQGFGQATEPRVDLDLAAIRHGITGIHHKVHDHLFQLPFVRADQGQTGIVAHAERGFFAHQSVQQMAELPKGVAQVKHLGTQGLFTRKRQQLPDQTGRAVGVLGNLVNVAKVRITLIVPH